jgi:twinfilin
VFSAAAPLTAREEEIELMKKTEVKTDFGTESRQKTLSGIDFPLTDATRQAILEASSGSYNYLQFRIDLKEENIHLAKAENIQLADLGSKVPSDSAR